MAKKYFVRVWETGEVAVDDEGNPMVYTTIIRARGECRALGHRGECAMCTTYPPVAYVSDEAGCLLYNPRFPKQDNFSGLSQVINQRQSDSL